MKIVICRSNRHAEFAFHYAKALEGMGFDVYCPEAIVDAEAWANMDEIDRRETAKRLVDVHFQAIDRSVIVVVCNVDGYIGASVNIEIGYAVAKEKRIFTIALDDDPLRSILFEGVAASPEELQAKLK